VSPHIVVVGAGPGAGAHLRALHAMGCPPAAVVTHDPERAARVRELFPGTTICWPTAAALDRGADLVIVASPAGTHLDVVRLAAGRRIDVVVEKPIEASIDRAHQLVGLCQLAPVGLAVCFQHRVKPAGRALSALWRSGALGRFTGGTVCVPWWRPASYFAGRGRGTYARDGGGVLATQAIHALDLLLWTVGVPRRVRAHASRAVHPIEAEDTVAGVLDYGEGRLVSVHATVAAYPGREEELWLTGTAGSLLLRGADLLRYTEPGAEPERVVSDEGASTAAADPAATPTAWHRVLLADALDAFATGRSPVADGGSALTTQRVVAALYASAHEDRWVDLTR